MSYLLALLVVIAILYFARRANRAQGLHPIPQDMLPDTFVVFDLETTGLKADTHEIIEVGAIRFKKGQTTHDTFQSLVTPNKKVPAKITELTGITQAMVDAEGEPLAKVLNDFAEFAGDLRLVTFNAAFDMAFLQAGAARAARPAFKNPVSCALKMARRAWPQRTSYRLDDLAASAGIAQGQAHRAMEDARRALIIYSATVGILRSVD